MPPLINSTYNTGIEEREWRRDMVIAREEWVQQYDRDKQIEEARLNKLKKKYPKSDSRQVRYYTNDDDDDNGDKGECNIMFNDQSNTTDVPLTSTRSASGNRALGTDVARGCSNRSASGKGALGSDVARGSRLDVLKDIRTDKGGKDIKANNSTLSSMDVPRPASIYMTDISNRNNRSNSVPNDTNDSALAAAVSGAVHTFLLWHFRLGHINYTMLYAAIQSGQLQGFPYSLSHIHVKYLPICRICQLMKNRHKPVSHIGKRMHELRPNRVYYLDLKTIRIRSINHEHYILVRFSVLGNVSVLCKERECYGRSRST
jgi:hypothetical protein